MQVKTAFNLSAPGCKHPRVKRIFVNADLISFPGSGLFFACLRSVDGRRPEYVPTTSFRVRYDD